MYVVVKTERLAILLSRNAIEILLGHFLCVTRLRCEYKSRFIWIKFYSDFIWREIGLRVSMHRKCATKLVAQHTHIKRIRFHIKQEQSHSILKEKSNNRLRIARPSTVEISQRHFRRNPHPDDSLLRNVVVRLADCNMHHSIKLHFQSRHSWSMPKVCGHFFSPPCIGCAPSAVVKARRAFSYSANVGWVEAVNSVVVLWVSIGLFIKQSEGFSLIKFSINFPMKCAVLIWNFISSACYS